MCAQLDLQVLVNSKRSPKEGIPSNFHRFWSEELHYEKNQKIYTKLMIEHHNLRDPME
jgi:hypothetical protein